MKKEFIALTLLSVISLSACESSHIMAEFEPADKPRMPENIEAHKLVEIEEIPVEPFVGLVEAIDIPDEYKNAFVVWDRLKEAGYNDYVAAGIMGNIMVECGGQTLNIKSNVYSKTKFYYGICQWNKKRYKEVFDKDLDFQITYLLDTIEAEFGHFGDNFSCNYNEFCNLEDEAKAARKFAQIYERCDKNSYGIRQKAARKALEYFQENY